MMDRQLRVVVGSIYARAYFCSVRVWERQTDRQKAMVGRHFCKVQNNTAAVSREIPGQGGQRNCD